MRINLAENSLLKIGISYRFWNNVVRPAVIKRDNNKCTKCGSEENLVVHHLTYIDETMSDLITLCTTCHGKLNKKGARI